MKKICFILAVIVLLGACGLTKEDLGMARSKPDETKVQQKSRGLVVPPDYGILP